MGNALGNGTLFVADGGRGAGLGHVSRCSAVAAALSCRGIRSRCHALGAAGPIEHRGVKWLSEPPEATPDPSRWSVLVLDSYELGLEDIARLTHARQVVVMNEVGAKPGNAALFVNPGADPSNADERHLYGFHHACLGPAFWGLPRRLVRDPVEKVVVTTGAGDLGGLGSGLAAEARRALPAARVVLVRGPHADSRAPEGVELVVDSDSLLDEFASADIVVSGAGQTLLEAAATGAVCVAVILAENQRVQAERLAGLGAARLVDPLDAVAAANILSELADAPGLRRELSQRAQHVVDGYGALRVAYRIARLLQA